MWIRSQDKKRLIDAADFEIVNATIYARTAATYATIAKYDRPEQAERVLHEIERFIMIGGESGRPMIYHMPGKDEI